MLLGIINLDVQIQVFKYSTVYFSSNNNFFNSLTFILNWKNIYVKKLVPAVPLLYCTTTSKTVYFASFISVRGAIDKCSFSFPLKFLFCLRNTEFDSFTSYKVNKFVQFRWKVSPSNESNCYLPHEPASNYHRYVMPRLPHHKL